jgi:hypothetical protein
VSSSDIGSTVMNSVCHLIGLVVTEHQIANYLVKGLIVASPVAATSNESHTLHMHKSCSSNIN